MRPEERTGTRQGPPRHHVLDGELTTITSNIDLPLDRYVIIIFQREGGRWCGQQSRVGAVVAVVRYRFVYGWHGGVGVGLAFAIAFRDAAMTKRGKRGKFRKGRRGYRSHDVYLTSIFWTDRVQIPVEEHDFILQQGHSSAAAAKRFWILSDGRI